MIMIPENRDWDFLAHHIARSCVQDSVISLFTIALSEKEIAAAKCAEKMIKERQKIEVMMLKDLSDRGFGNIVNMIEINDQGILEKVVFTSGTTLEYKPEDSHVLDTDGTLTPTEFVALFVIVEAWLTLVAGSV